MVEGITSHISPTPVAWFTTTMITIVTWTTDGVLGSLVYSHDISVIYRRICGVCVYVMWMLFERRRDEYILGRWSWWRGVGIIVLCSRVCVGSYVRYGFISYHTILQLQDSADTSDRLLATAFSVVCIIRHPAKRGCKLMHSI